MMEVMLEDRVKWLLEVMMEVMLEGSVVHRVEVIVVEV